MSPSGLRSDSARVQGTASLIQLATTWQSEHSKPLLGKEGLGTTTALSLGIEALDRFLPEGGLPHGQLTELTHIGLSGWSTWLALVACYQVQHQACRTGASAVCAFVDPRGELFAPTLLAMGIALDQLLIVRPPVASLARTAVKLARSNIFSLIVVDLLSAIAGRSNTPARTSLRSKATPRSHLSPGLSQWIRATRQISLAIQGNQTVVLLLTDDSFPRTQPLPVGMRLHLANVIGNSEQQLSIAITKDKRGRLRAPQIIPISSTRSQSVSSKPWSSRWAIDAF